MQGIVPMAFQKTPLPMVEDALVEEHQGIHAWLWVAGATFPFTAQSVRNASTFGSVGKRSLRDRMPWKRTNRTIQST